MQRIANTIIEQISDIKLFVGTRTERGVETEDEPYSGCGSAGKRKSVSEVVNGEDRYFIVEVNEQHGKH